MHWITDIDTQTAVCTTKKKQQFNTIFVLLWPALHHYDDYVYDVVNLINKSPSPYAPKRNILNVYGKENEQKESFLFTNAHLKFLNLSLLRWMYLIFNEKCWFFFAISFQFNSTVLSGTEYGNIWVRKSFICFTIQLCYKYTIACN